MWVSSIGDTLAALHGTIGVLTALYHRKVNGGKGQVIDVALHEAVFNVMESLIPEYSAFGWCARRLAVRCRALHRATPTPARTAGCWWRAMATASSSG